MKHKYVRHSTLGFVLWPMSDALIHSDVGHEVEANVSGRIISAGFAYFVDGTVSCSGRSESLGIDSLPDDSAALARQLGITAQANPVRSPTKVTATSMLALLAAVDTSRSPARNVHKRLTKAEKKAEKRARQAHLKEQA